MFSKKIILASASPRRAELLNLAGVTFDIKISNVDEEVLPTWTAEETVIRLAQKKATAVHDANGDLITVGADTIVVLAGSILGKPNNLIEAKEVLKQLSGKSHEVITGVAICQHHQVEVFAEKSTVYFRTLTEEQIDYYLQNFPPLDKAGAYAIQEYIGAVGIEKIIGDYYNVVGLPVGRLLHCLNTKFND